MSMEKGCYIITIGGVCFDEYYTTPHWIDEGDKCIIQHKASVVGGMIANAACVMAGYGENTFFVDVMNDGPSNKKLLDNLSGYSVNTDFVSYGDMPDSKCLIITTSRERTIFVVDRGPARLSFSARQIELFLHAGYVYSTMSDFQRCDDALHFADMLRANGVKLAFDVEPSTFDTNEAPLFQKADILMFNRQGIEKYCGGGTWEESVQALLQRGVSAVTVTLGSKGCYGAMGRDAIYLDGIDVPVVDTTGAGDTFNASFLHCYKSGESLRYALQFANVAASHSVTVAGARGGVSSAAYVEQLMRRFYGHDAASGLSIQEEKRW